MKGLKLVLAVFTVAMMIAGVSGMAFAFHSGGVAECEGCHSMHDAQSGALLTKSDIGSTCLNCHENANGDAGPTSYHVSTRTADLGAGIGMAPKQRTPGGDFGWLKMTYIFLQRGSTITEDGASHGHNIQAVDNGYSVVDGATAPGGDYPADQLTCTSCHDMHSAYRRVDTTGTLVKPAVGTAVPPIAGSGSYHNSADPVAGSTAVGVFRLLAGNGFTTANTTFVVDPPHAVVNSTYNKSEASATVRDAYGKGMAEWCATCHPNMHTNSGRLVHPVSQNFGATIQGNYNAYVKSGDWTGVQPTSYSSLVPYEENSTDYTVLKGLAANTAKLQPGPNSDTVQVMCLSCHRAHASGWPEMLRWMYQNEFMTRDGMYPGLDNTQSSNSRGRMAIEAQAAYYDRPASDFATWQRMLCNKCHAKD